MYPPPSQRHLRPEQAQELDRTFLDSDPFAYFSSRIAMYLNWLESAGGANPSAPSETSSSPEDDTTEPDSVRFARLVGHPVGLVRDDTAVLAQIAADTFSLRHHVAESLVRLAVALARVAKSEADDPPCLWLEIMRSPTQTSALVAELKRWVGSEEADPELFARLVGADPSTGLPTDTLESAVSVFARWMERAVELMTRNDLDLNHGHNRIKHGFAVRARDDMKVSFSPLRPDTDGSISAAALNESSVDILSGQVMEFLAKGPGKGSGLELVQAQLDAVSMLAESYMLAWTHAAIFRTAFQLIRRTAPEVSLAPPFPVGGPLPHHIVADTTVLGMRFPLTLSDTGQPRSGGVAFVREFRELTFNGPPMRNIRVTD